MQGLSGLESRLNRVKQVLRAVLWKELKDLSRDKRTLLIIVGLPLVTLPLLGVVTFYLNKEQPANIALVDLDNTPVSQRFSSELKNWITAYAQAMGQRVEVMIIKDYDRAISNTSIDYVVVINKGFGENLTSLDKTAIIKLSKRVETVRAQTAETIVSLSLNSIARVYAEKRISELSRMAGVSIDPTIVLEPIRRETQVHKGAGVQASPEEEYKFYTVRFLSFALLFVVMPTITYVSDAIMGEKERRTFESLLATPLGKRDILLGKIIASSMLGVSASIADVVGVIIYFYFLQRTFGASTLQLDSAIVVFHSIDVAITVLVTIMMITPLVLRAGSVRSANVTSTAVLGAAMIIFFASLFTDLDRLPDRLAIPLLLFPYTHSVLALTSFVSGNLTRTLFHVVVLLGFSLVFFLLALRMFDKEKIIMPPSRSE